MSLFQNKHSLSAKLTATQVQDIREKYASGRFTQGALAREHQVGIGTIGRIVRQESWQGLQQLPPTGHQLQAIAERAMELQRQLDQEAEDPFTKLAAEAERLRRGDKMIEELQAIDPPGGTSGQGRGLTNMNVNQPAGDANAGSLRRMK